MSVLECQECQAHDEATQNKIQSVLEYRELVFLVVNATHAVKNMNAMVSKLPENDLRILTIQRDADAGNRAIGKLIIGFDELARRALIKQLEKSGVSLQLEHAQCPHVKQEGA